MHATIYDELNRVVYEGPAEYGWRWIKQNGARFSDGVKLFRMWMEDGYYYYDVGYVYHSNAPLVTLGEN